MHTKKKIKKEINKEEENLILNTNKHREDAIAEIKPKNEIFLISCARKIKYFFVRGYFAKIL